MMRIICWILGHRWTVKREQYRWMIWMAHLCCNVGQDRTCLRCGLRYDFTNPNEGLWGPIVDVESAAKKSLGGEA